MGGYSYVTGAYHGEAWGEPNATADEVVEQDRSPTFTGLLDCNGNKIFRVEEHPPIGFRPERWRSFGGRG